MNRYLFKAKRRDDGQWIKGTVLFHDVDAATIFNQNAADGSLQGFEVDPSSVCQCTGLKDKNGKLIWENDIVKDEHGNLYKAFWQNNYYQFSWICVSSEIFQSGIKWDLYVMRSFEIEVIGNIFDNPELLESEE